MEYEVVVTRKGQTTIPAAIRKKYGINVGTRLIVVDVDEGILMKPMLSTADLAGSGARSATPEEMRKRLDELRNEDV